MKYTTTDLTIVLNMSAAESEAALDRISDFIAELPEHQDTHWGVTEEHES